MFTCDMTHVHVERNTSIVMELSASSLLWTKTGGRKNHCRTQLADSKG